MRKLNPAISLAKDVQGNYTRVEYSVFAPGEKYQEVDVVQVQVENYSAGEVPGIKATVTLTKLGPGNPFSFSGSFNIDPTLSLDSNRPFLDVGIYVLDPVTQELDRKGGGIVRNIDSDSEG